MHHEINFRLQQRGVTLIEMIVAIVVMGVLVALTSMFVRNQVTSYMDIAARADLADEADTAVRRLTRDFQAALPNSVRMPVGGTTIIEFVPIEDAGRYRAQKGVLADDELDFASLDNSFEVFGPPVTVQAGDQLVISNLGIAGADFYAGDTRRPLTSVGSLNTLIYTVGAAQFPFASPQSRFQVVSTPVTYAFEAATRTLWRYSGYAIQPVQVVTIAGLDALAGVTKVALATDVDVANSSFAFAAAALQRNAIVSIRLTLTRNGEGVVLFQQLNIFNSP
jgi:MSHA biogenesis protein MshO